MSASSSPSAHVSVFLGIVRMANAKTRSASVAKPSICIINCSRTVSVIRSTRPVALDITDVQSSKTLSGAPLTNKILSSLCVLTKVDMRLRSLVNSAVASLTNSCSQYSVLRMAVSPKAFGGARADVGKPIFSANTRNAISVASPIFSNTPLSLSYFNVESLQIEQHIAKFAMADESAGCFTAIPRASNTSPCVA